MDTPLNSYCITYKGEFTTFYSTSYIDVFIPAYNAGHIGTSLPLVYMLPKQQPPQMSVTPLIQTPSFLHITLAI